VATNLDLDVFNVGAVILRPSDGGLLHDPRLNVLHFTMKLKQLLGLNELATSRRRQLY